MKVYWLVAEPTHLEKYAQGKLDHFPNFRGENNEICETTT